MVKVATLWATISMSPVGGSARPVGWGSGRTSSGYMDLLQGRDLDNDSELVDFYTLVMERRKKRGWN